MTPERLAELHEAAKYANSHGNGQVSLKATELLEVLPALPVEEKAAEPAIIMGTIAAIERTESFAQELAAEPPAVEANADPAGQPSAPSDPTPPTDAV